MRLDQYTSGGFQRGRARWVEVLWLLLQGVFASGLPGSAWRVWLLRRFGARLGRGLVLKPRVRIKFPWRLQCGDHVWIGESVWIDNLAEVTLGNHVCVSQGAYLCTGSHDWTDPRFGLITRAIRVADGAWVGAFARLAPGCTVESGAVVGMGVCIGGTVPAHTVVRLDRAALRFDPRGEHTP